MSPKADFNHLPSYRLQPVCPNPGPGNFFIRPNNICASSNNNQTCPEAGLEPHAYSLKKQLRRHPSKKKRKRKRFEIKIKIKATSGR